MSGATHPLRHVPFRRVHDTFMKTISDVVLWFVAMSNCLPYIHSRSSLIVAWAEYIPRTGGDIRADF
jgi:hypothetical protein